jgi:hypothetical protein
MKVLSRLFIFMFIFCLTACAGSNKRGCPANDANLGAERVMAGEGKKKPTKFKVKGMDKAYTQ